MCSGERVGADRRRVQVAGHQGVLGRARRRRTSACSSPPGIKVCSGEHASTAERRRVQQQVAGHQGVLGRARRRRSSACSSPPGTKVCSGERVGERRRVQQVAGHQVVCSGERVGERRRVQQVAGHQGVCSGERVGAGRRCVQVRRSSRCAPASASAQNVGVFK